MITVQQAMLYGKGDLRFERRNLTDCPATREVYVRTLVTALSTGTDLANYQGRSTEVPGAPDYPRPIGYSHVGLVALAGNAVSRLQEGQRVFSLSPQVSGYLASEDDILVPVPENVGSKAASLSYLTQLGLAALRGVSFEPGEKVAVVGLGIIGLATAALAAACGADVVAIGDSPLRIEVAQKVGVNTALHAADTGRLGKLFGGTGADIIVLTANSWDAYRTSVEVARVGGRISILGFPGRAQALPDFNVLDPAWFYRKSLTLYAAGSSPRLECEASVVRFNLRRNLEFILNLMSNGHLVLDPLITHCYPAARMREAYELAVSHSKDLIAAVFEWEEQEGHCGTAD